MLNLTDTSFVGHADGESNVIEVSLRVIHEESGLCDPVFVSHEIFDIDIHLIPARAWEPADYHYDVRFAFQAQDSQSIVASDESHDLNWVRITKLSDYSEEESMLQMARKWQALS